jgi:hypothetical protein
LFKAQAPVLDGPKPEIAENSAREDDEKESEKEDFRPGGDVFESPDHKFSVPPYSRGSGHKQEGLTEENSETSIFSPRPPRLSSDIAQQGKGGQIDATLFTIFYKYREYGK